MKRGGGVSGAVSLVMIFCVLCLAVFAVLTLATADRERVFSELTAQRAAEYYEADRRAVELVAAMCSGGALDGEILVTSIQMDTPEGPAEEASFSIPAGENQSLEVRVLLRGGEAEVLSWRTVYTGSWEVDNTITLWDGD